MKTHNEFIVWDKDGQVLHLTNTLKDASSVKGANMILQVSPNGMIQHTWMLGAALDMKKLQWDETPVDEFAEEYLYTRIRKAQHGKHQLQAAVMSDFQSNIDILHKRFKWKPTDLN